jgi:hypothetical protein
MKKLLTVISIIALLDILACSVLVFLGKMPHSRFTLYAALATLVWFATSPFWLAPKKK